MKKFTDSTGPGLSLLISTLVFALGIVFRPPTAAAMDIQLVLATEEIVKEMRENGELSSNFAAETMILETVNPSSESVPAGEEGVAETSRPGFEREEPVPGTEIIPAVGTEGLTVETEVVPAPDPEGLIVETEVIPAPDPEGLIVETEVVPEFAPEGLIVETEVVPASESEGLIVETVVVPVSESEELIVETGAVPAGTLQESLDRRVTVKYIDTDIRVVLRSLARAYNFNVTLAPEVQGKVTVDFSNVKIRDVLEAVLIDQGFGYQISGEIIRVTTREKIQEETAASAQKATVEAEKSKAEAEVVEPLVVEIFNLRYIDASDARDAILPMLTVGRGQATVLKTKQFRGFQFEAVETFSDAGDGDSTEFVRSRTLIVQDTRAVLDRIEEIILKIDYKPPQILIDAKILEVPISQESRLGINWTEALNGWKVGFSDLKATFDKHYSSLDSRYTGSSQEWGADRSEEYVDFDRRTLTDSQEYSSISQQDRERLSEQASEDGIPSQLDEASRSSMSEIMSSDVRTILRERGYDDKQSEKIFDNYLNEVADTLTTMATAGQTYKAVLNAADFSLILSALRTDSNVVILSNPRIIVHENYAAQIFVGQRYPILSTEFESGEGASAIGGTSVDKWQEIGITLKVIPQIRSLLSGADGINMIVHPAVSDISGYAFAYDPLGRPFQSTYPIISIREADTNVTIGDGDTIVIGGLISSYTEDKVSKIPLLGDIPILGYLFKEEYSKVVKTNLLIFITARIVTEETQFSAYEKLMLEKAPPEALGDVRYFEDERVRPYLYRPPAEAAPEGEESNPPADDQPVEDSEVEAGNQGNFPGRVTTKAMKRSQR